MKVLSLFSGVGMFDLGLTLAGMEIVGQVEISGPPGILYLLGRAIQKTERECGLNAK
jgi:site-specific DNA-cytosine methylase